MQRCVSGDMLAQLFLDSALRVTAVKQFVSRCQHVALATVSNQLGGSRCPHFWITYAAVAARC